MREMEFTVKIVEQVVQSGESTSSGAGRKVIPFGEDYVIKVPNYIEEDEEKYYEKVRELIEIQDISRYIPIEDDDYTDACDSFKQFEHEIYVYRQCPSFLMDLLCPMYGVFVDSNGHPMMLLKKAIPVTCKMINEGDNIILKRDKERDTWKITAIESMCAYLDIDYATYKNRIDMMCQYTDLHLSDLDSHYSNWGVIEENGVKRLVILDAGI